jgi:hypothetical protein
MKWKVYDRDHQLKGVFGDIKSALKSKEYYMQGPNGEQLGLWEVSTHYRPYLIYANGCHVWTVIAYSPTEAIKKYRNLRTQVTTSKLEARKV